MSERPARSWNVSIGRGPDRQPLRFGMWIAEDAARQPIDVRVMCGGPLASILQDFSEALSVNLRNGVPVHVFVHTFRGRRDETGGPVEGDPLVTECGSVVDYVARALEARYCQEESDG